MKSTSTMTRAEIKAELADLVRQWDALSATVVLCNEPGSPSESIVERMGELEQALKRGAYLR